MGSLGFRRGTVSESPTCWGDGAANPNKLGTPARYPHQFPKTQLMEDTYTYIARSADDPAQAVMFTLHDNSMSVGLVEELNRRKASVMGPFKLLGVLDYWATWLVAGFFMLGLLGIWRRCSPSEGTLRLDGDC